jgi:hypothetical protein
MRGISEKQGLCVVPLLWRGWVRPKNGNENSKGNKREEWSKSKGCVLFLSFGEVR